MGRADFVVILAPQAQILRPVTDKGRCWVAQAFADKPQGIGGAVGFVDQGAFNDALDGLSGAGLTVELL